EAGVGVLSGQFQQYNAVMATTDFTYTAGNAFLTGVVFKDFDANQFYSPTGEGYGNIAVKATNVTTQATFSTNTFSTGGYSLQLPAGTYDVTFGGGILRDTTFLEVTIGDQNVKLDVIDSTLLRPWSNPNDPLDVDGDGFVQSSDVITLIED